MAPSYKRQAVLIWLFALPALCYAQEEDLSLLLERQIPKWQQQYRVPGAGVALIREAELVWAEGFGKTGALAGEPVRPSTIFKAGPVTTSLTAWGVMKLVEQGRLDLDAPVEQYLKRWELPPSRYDHSRVTVRRLLSHSSGIPNPDYPARFEAGEVPASKSLLSGVADDLPPIHVSHPPGARFLYSKPGYSLLAMVIEDVTGEDFPGFMEREVFRPLKMRGSFIEAAAAPGSRLPHPHNYLGEPLARRYENQPAAEGLYTTPLDLARFVAAGLPNLQNEIEGYPVIGREVIERMQEPAVRTGGRSRFLATHHGLGYFVDEVMDDTRSVILNGGFQPPGWHAYFFAFPETGDGLVVLTNGRNGISLTHAIADEWVQTLDVEPPRLIRNLTLSERCLRGGIVAGGALCLFSLGILLRDLRHRKRRLARSRWPARLAVLLAMATAAALAWTEGQQWLLNWHPHLLPWPQISLSAFLGAAALLSVTEHRDT